MVEDAAAEDVAKEEVVVEDEESVLDVVDDAAADELLWGEIEE